MKTKYRHIYFEESGLTEGYVIRNNKTKNYLGNVIYYILWKKYIVEFSAKAVFDESCLLDIADFLKQLGD